MDTNHKAAGILKAFPLDAYAVVDLLPGVPDNDIKKRYRERSLLIHPDKCKHPRAPDAFDRLKKAQEALLDEKERAKLDEAIADARMLLIREHKWTVDSEELKTDEFREEWRDKTRVMLVEDELRRRRQIKAEMREQGRQQQKDDQEAEERKRKREFEAEWERTRDDRIESWRGFQASRGVGEKKKEKRPIEDGAADGVNGSEKKKKVKKLKVLG